MKRWLPLALLAALLLWFGLRPPPSPGDELVSREFPAMGTWVSLSLYLEQPDRRAGAERALAAIESAMHAFDRRWRPDGDGALGKINRGPGDRFPEDMHALRDRALHWYRLSGGLFDPRLGALVSLWGFDRAEAFRDRPPEDTAIHRALEKLVAAPAERDGGGWNFGAIAKGWIVDRAMEQLQAAGHEHAIINAGGNLRVAGRRGDRPWRIAVRHPRPDDARRFLATIEVTGDAAIITSGDYERYFEHGGRRYHHLLDPRSGRPARGLQSLTVIGDSATDADALSTALFVAGPSGWPALAEQLGAEAVIAVDSEGVVTATPTARKLARFPAHSTPQP